MSIDNQETLLGFNWESDEDDFFGLTETEDTPPKKEVQEEEEEETPPASKEIKEEEDSSFFDEDEEEEGEPTKKSSTSSSIYSDVYKDLKEQGLLNHVEIEEGEEIDAEKLFELQQREYEAEMTSRLQHWASEELDEDAQAFIKFKRDGGNTSDFFKTYSSSSKLPTGDISDEDFQDKVIKYQLREEGWDLDEIEDRLRYLTDNGTKEKAAARYNKKIQEQVELEKNATLQEASRQREAIKLQEKGFNDSVRTALDEIKDIKGFKITDKDKTELYNFMTKKSFKVSDSKTITGFQKKLGETFKDSSKMILLAKLINSDFDMKDLEKATVTKKTKQIKSNLEQRKGLRPTNSGSSLEGNSLAELFN